MLEASSLKQYQHQFEELLRYVISDSLSILGMYDHNIGKYRGLYVGALRLIDPPTSTPALAAQRS